MENTKEILAKYWPYVAGAIIGLILIMRYMGGRATTSTGSSDLASFYAAQTAQGQQAMQLAAQTAQIQAVNDAAARQDALARDTLAAQTKIGTIQAEAQMAQAVGQSAAGVVGALYGPTVQAINSAGVENAAAFQSAALVAATGFQSQSAIVKSTSDTVGAVGSSLQLWEGLSQGVGSILNPPQQMTQQLTPQQQLQQTQYQRGNSGLFGGSGGNGQNY